MYCRRRLLVGRLLVARAMLERDPGASVAHIRGDGRVGDEAEMGRTLGGSRQLALFKEAEPWRSARSASPSTPQRASLES